MYGNGNLPPGSYTQSCTHITMRGRRSSSQYGNGNGYGYGSSNGGRYGRYRNRYGNNAALPQGSYQQSCTNAQMNGNTLSASCLTPNGQRVYSRLNVNRCNGSTDIRNIKGYLRC
jgi:hypothetical protein